MNQSCSRLLFLMQIAFLAAGCGHTRLREVHTYIARDAAANEVSFVRVTIDAKSTGSETHY